MFWVIIIRSIIGAVIGWIVGVMLTRIMFAIDNWRLNRKMNKINAKTFA
jgi:membrane protein YqaA with SNARE-associated domain